MSTLGLEAGAKADSITQAAVSEQLGAAKGPAEQSTDDTSG